MKFPEDVRRLLTRRFRNKHREWLAAGADSGTDENNWPLVINLDTPTQAEAQARINTVRDWVNAWQDWRGAGTVMWAERRWRNLGTQKLPEKLELESATQIAQWVNESERWQRAQTRFHETAERWPALADTLPRYFDLLADYSETDFQRLRDMLDWLLTHPDSGLYPRQIPLSGLDSKWLEKRKAILSDWLGAIQGKTNLDANSDFYQRCGLRKPPTLIRLRLLDAELREQFGGLGDISAPLEQLAAFDLPLTTVFIVENLQTGLAFSDIPNALVIMQLGYNVDVLGRLPWLADKRCIYWGDIDTHGLAILSRARARLPQLQSMLMDETTLLQYRQLWVEEKKQNGADSLPGLNEAEQVLYQRLKSNYWERNIRLEQERIDWRYAWQKLLDTISLKD